MLGEQLAQLKTKNGHVTQLGPLILPGELLHPMLSSTNAVAPQLLKPCKIAAKFGKVGFFLIWSQLIGQLGQSWVVKLTRNS